MTLLHKLSILASGTSDLISLAIRCGILLGILIVAFVVVRWIQKKLDPRQQQEASTGVMTMEQVEAIYDAGQITEEEFSRMRRMILGLPETKEKSSDCETDVVIMPDSLEKDNPAAENKPVEGVEKEES